MGYLRCGVLGLLAVSLLVSPCLAQFGPRGGQRNVGRMLALAEEVYLLNRLVTLQLTDVQLAALLEAYEKVPATAPGQPEDERVAKLLEIKGRLLAGTPLVAADLGALREAMRGRERPGEGRPAPPPETAPPGPLGEALWKLLTPEQQHILLGGDPGGAKANNQKATRDQARDFIQKLGPMRQIEEAAWPARRDALADALASGSGAPGTPARQNGQKLFVDYLDRIRRMTDADFLSKRAELAAELEALLPTGTSLTLVWASLDPQVVVRALEASFLHYRAQGLLREIQLARQRAAAG